VGIDQARENDTTGEIPLLRGLAGECRRGSGNSSVVDRQIDGRWVIL
jgi:hypothetical protein